jgi:transposase InsO family protein
MTIGLALKLPMTVHIVTDALTVTWSRRKPASGLMHHSDRGSQYASQAFRTKLQEYGMACSLSRKGNCWENAVSVKANARIAIRRNNNAPSKSWFKSFKNERVHGERLATRAEMAVMALEYIEVFYNRKRLHSTLGYKAPFTFLQDWPTAQQLEKQRA